MNSVTTVGENNIKEPKPAQTEEEQLISAARSGNGAAFEVLMMRSHRLVMAIARRMTGSLEVAEDLTQQIFMKAYVNISRFGGRCSFSTWLVSIAINEARMWNRKARHSRLVSMDDLYNGETFEMPRPEITDWRPGPEHLCSQAESSRHLLFEIEHLPLGIREALKICDIEEQSTTTAAILLGITVNAVKSRRLHGRLALRRALESSLPPEKHRSHQSGHHRAEQSSRQRGAPITRTPPALPEPACPARV